MKQNIIKKFYEILRKDKEFSYGFQSNIAMDIFDVYYQYKKNKEYINKKDMHRIVNVGARRFLNRLIEE